jgi:serine/threonine protein kinase
MFWGASLNIFFVAISFDRFMAPECYRHEDYNETVDVYSFAMILFYLLVGRPPWPNVSGINAVKKASEEGDRPNVPRDLDVRMQNLLKECWHEHASSRPPFSVIVNMITQYSRDVFKVNTNMVLSAEDPHAAGTECNCSIM